MTTYNFTHTVKNTDSFEAYLVKNFPDVKLSVSVSGDQITLVSPVQLSDAQLVNLTTLITNYVDPVLQYKLAYTESMSGVSEKTNSQIPKDVESFIFPSNTNSQYFLNSLKTIVKVETNNVATFTGVTGGNVTINIYDNTRNISIGSYVVDLTSTISNFQELAAVGATGYATNYVTQMFSDLYAHSTNYDCIWLFRVSTSSPYIYARLEGLQKMFYNSV